jgi:hypothetical protein
MNVRTERRSWTVSSVAPYMGSPEFKYQTWRPAKLKHLVIFLSPSIQILGQQLKISRNSFLQNILEHIFHRSVALVKSLYRTSEDHRILIVQLGARIKPLSSSYHHPIIDSSEGAEHKLFERKI